MRRTLIAAAALAGLVGPAGASVADDVKLDNPVAFERAYATSFYGFDACGAQLTGKVFRDVLAAKFAMCPFTPAARAQYQKWTKAQRTKSVDAIQQMILDHDGLPSRLPGMTTTCHAQITSAPFQDLQAKLDGFQRGEINAAAILKVPCDSAEIAP